MFKSIANWKNFKILAWHVGDEHVHLYIIIPPKYSLSYAVCILKSKSSAWIKKKTKKFPLGSLWCRGYYISTIGINEQQIKRYINNQTHHRKDLQTLPLWKKMTQSAKQKPPALSWGYVHFYKIPPLPFGHLPLNIRGRRRGANKIKKIFGLTKIPNHITLLWIFRSLQLQLRGKS